MAKDRIIKARVDEQTAELFDRYCADNGLAQAEAIRQLVSQAGTQPISAGTQSGTQSGSAGARIESVGPQSASPVTELQPILTAIEAASDRTIARLTDWLDNRLPIAGEPAEARRAGPGPAKPVTGTPFADPDDFWPA